MNIGEKVIINPIKVTGTLKFIGETEFKEGVWAGIELDQLGTGKNDGSVQGIRYFHCPSQTGIFVLATKIALLSDEQTLRILQLESQLEHILSDNTALQEHIVSLQDTLCSKDQTIEDLRKAGMESIDLYHQTIEIHRADREALLQELEKERHKASVLELQCADLRQAGRDTIETYEATLKSIQPALDIEKEKLKELLKTQEQQLKEKQEIELQRDNTLTDLQQANKALELECLALMEEVEQLHRQDTKDIEKAHQREIQALNKKISELERLMEFNVFKATDFEEALEKERHKVKQLELEIEDLKTSPYCENCDEFGLHFTYQCPHQDETF